MQRGEGIPKALVDEGERIMRLCNACRYCEGFCAVFPALERRLTFAEGDLTYLANLCHNCGECYHACQYAPPHQFELSLPRTLAQIRGASYRKYAWPRALGGLFRSGGWAAVAATAAGAAFLLLWMLATAGPARLVTAYSDARGAFHALMSHRDMVLVFGAAGLWAAVGLGLGAVAFWRDTGERANPFLSPGASLQAVWDALRLRYLDGGGDGCAYPDDVPSHARRFFHHLTFYGFMLCFAATSVAAVYHYVLGRHAPYPRLSLPVVLGTVGGAGLLVGPVGLLALKVRRNPELTDPAQGGMDVAFLVMLQLTSLSGLLLLAFRETATMGSLLVIHLGLVLGLFLTMPYGKFIHGIHRLAALARDALEQRHPRRRIDAE